MFLPNDPIVYNGQKGTVVSTFEHIVTVETEDGQHHTTPEHKVRRPPPPAYKRTMDGDVGEDRLDFATVHRLKGLIQTIALDWRGHHLNGAHWDSGGRNQTPKARQRELFRTVGLGGEREEVSKGDVEAILLAAETGVPLDRYIPIVTGEKDLTCGHCDVVDFETNGRVIRPVAPCPNPEGLVTEFTLNVPSGKVIIDDDLRFLCRIAHQRDINSPWGTHLAILDYANNGLVVGFGIGNTSPRVYRMGDGAYSVGHFQKRIWEVPEGTPGARLQDDGGDSRWYVTEMPEDRGGKYDQYGDDIIDDLPDGAVEVASVCTDLWAYSIIDFEEAQRRAVYYGEDLSEKGVAHIVEIPAGLYKFRHFHRARFDEGVSGKVLFATFERVGDALPPDDWCARGKAFSVDFSQAVQYKQRVWSGRYGQEEWARACAAVAFSEFQGCVPRRDWHMNGHKNNYLPEDVVGLEIREIPRFRFRGYWKIRRSVLDTVVSRKDEMFGGDIPLNQSYAMVAGRILESAISFGLTPEHNTWDKKDPRYDEYMIPEARAEMHNAAGLWRGLIARYPHVAVDMADFAAWMADGAAVVRWIDHFDLGPAKYDREAATRHAEEADAQRRRALVTKRLQVPGTQVQWIGDESRLGVTVEGTCPEGFVCVQEGDSRLEVVDMGLLDLGPRVRDEIKVEQERQLAALRVLLDKEREEDDV